MPIDRAAFAANLEAARAAPPPPAGPGSFAVRVRRPGFVDRLIAEDAPPPDGLCDMAECADSPGEWGRAPLTFDTAAAAREAAREWEAHYGELGYAFGVVERVMVPTWRAAGGGEG